MAAQAHADGSPKLDGTLATFLAACIRLLTKGDFDRRVMT